MFLDRNGYLEETWFTFSLSPIRGDRGEVAGLFHPVTETSARMLAERRAGFLRDLAASVSDLKTTAEAVSSAIATVGTDPLDLPRVLVYLHDPESGQARLVGHTDIEPGQPFSPQTIDLSEDSPVARAVLGTAPVISDDWALAFGQVDVDVDVENEPQQRLFVAPLPSPGDRAPGGALVIALSRQLPLDVPHRAFLDLVAQTIGAALTSATAREQERARARAVVELSQAKTAFFENVSHEFRTPLTLMLGPVEDELAETGGPSERRERLEMVHRNGLRLLRLVNTLLDFARVESGRVQPSLKATDLSAFTADLAGVFRYPIESVGLRFVVDCDPLPEPVFVDRDMWERIVLNLLSNAFKHTFEGTVTVALRWVDERAELRISDTGIGITADELPRLFERFHRVTDARSRTIEGTGLGLALVQDLIQRHGGVIAVTSEPGQGTTFTLTLPAGQAGHPPQQIRDLESSPTGSGLAAAQAEEALGWIAADAIADPRAGPRTRARPAGAPLGRVLLAEDNADMRRHVTRILQEHFDVDTAPDGRTALALAIAHPPDLVLTDVMMPRLDGFGLLAGLRAEEHTRTIPVIMLSARAGEEASMDGIRAGVDDYLAKPFTGPELIARVSRSLALAQLRRESEQQLAATNARLTAALAKLDALARTDPLTGVTNRRGWEEALPLELARARRGSYGLCMALVDLDGLKLYNDTLGHLAGDQLLADAAVAWAGAVRITDLIARVGGDEFAVLMPDCAPEDAQDVIGRICAATPHGQTCSVGIAIWDGADPPEALTTRADAELYRAKSMRATAN
jgi:diguanylate cyclase (GGDEF)-like protein